MHQLHRLGLASGGKINWEGCFEGSGPLPDVANSGLYTEQFHRLPTLLPDIDPGS